ncbi:aminotransferase class III-fold pyridoxal phosphate-dependent enzyme [Crocinitomicaceae bacterium]|nr:aminotransferase class III-fold pyridoxal phosphate-dependent enzyme [Crocinitomicaceae bacterium]
MKDIIKKEFGISPIEITKINGYDNINYLIKTEGESFIFKTYPASESNFALLEAESQALLFLQKESNSKTPKPIPFIDKSYTKNIAIHGVVNSCRLLSFLKGEFLGDININKQMALSLGNFLANLDTELMGYDNAELRSRKCEWDIQQLSLNKKYISDISDVSNQNLVRYFFMQFEQNVAPIVNELRMSFIHSDANEWNILIKGNEVNALIDFGDMVYSPLINEIATAITYVGYDKENLFEFTPSLLHAYHKIIPLEEKEISILYYLIASKLCISVCHSANAKKHNPKNTYASVSENNAWKMLYKLLEINPISFENEMLRELGLKYEKPTEVIEKLKRRHKHMSKILSVSYDQPIVMDKCAFQYMYDVYGNSYLDAYNNIPHVGHSHPFVVEAGQKQMAKLNTNTRYLYDKLAEYSEQLLSKFPTYLNKVFFVNSGSEANDLAIRMAKIHSRKDKIMVMEHGYHGHTQIGIDVSDYKFNHPKGQGQKTHIVKTAIPNAYNGKYSGSECGKRYAKDAIDQIHKTEEGIAAFICEPIVGCGGQIPIADGYLAEVYNAIRSQGGVCISDEVQTGFGRLGDVFWGFEQHKIQPDIVVIGKPMGNGHPMGAVITTESISNSFEQGVEFFSSFGGNPVSCAIGKAVLDVIESEKLQENALKCGQYYKSLFEELQSKHSCIGDVRGSGLFLGIELIDKLGNPNTNLAKYIKNELRKNHILISTDGPYDSVIKTKPPLVFNRENALRVVEEIDQIIQNK